MLRHAVIAILLFLGIATLAYFLAQRPEPPAVPALPTVVPTPEVEARLLPSGDFLPRASLPEMTVETQVPKLVARFYRITDPALLLRLYRGALQDSLSNLAVARLLDDNSKPVHIAELTIKNGRAKLAWNSVAADVPGFYAVTLARAPRAPAFAASWFMRNDLLITAVEDRENWHILCQDMASAAPRSGVRLTWLGLDNAVPLAEQDCGATGQLTMAKSALEQNSVPLLLRAQDQRGQLAFVPLRTVRLPPDDRHAAATILTTERQHYLPGQTVQVFASRLEEKAENLRFDLLRPDGLRIAKTYPGELRHGVGWGQFVLPHDAVPGRWRIVTHGKDSVARETTFQVGQDTPQGQSRLKLVSRDETRVTVVPILLDAQGNALTDKAASVTLSWEPVRVFPELADGYAFGGLDAEASAPVKLANLVVKQSVPVSLTLPQPPQTNTPMQARLELQPIGQPETMAQPLLLRFPPTPWALGIKPEFEPDDLRGNSQANFRLSLLPTVKKTAKTPLPSVQYELLTERRSFRWFFVDGSWHYESDVAVAPVLSGSVTLGEDRTGMMSVAVQPGQYRLEAFTPDRKLLTSWRFNVAQALRVPPLRSLTATVTREMSGKIMLTTSAANTQAVIAADQTVQEFRPYLPGSEPQALATTLSQGGHVAIMGTNQDESGVWQLQGARHWLPPQDYPDLRAVSLTLPDTIVAGSIIPLSLSLPPAEKRERYAQVVAVPLEGKTPARPLLQNLQGERNVAFAVVSNIPADWPPTKTPDTLRQPPVLGESRLSPIVVVPSDGRVNLTLPLPVPAEKVALHVLVWDELSIGEKVQEVALQTVSSTTPITVLAQPRQGLPLPQSWHLSCLPPLPGGQTSSLSLVHDKTLTQTPVVLLSPLPVPDLGRLLSQLWAADTNRSDVLARSLLALQSYRALLESLGVKTEQFRAWQSQIISALTMRQRGDGGIALYGEAMQSDLTASAFALLAWHSMQDDPMLLERQQALLDYIMRRLDVAWGAETEIYARSDAFYALGVLGKIDPAALRYFVEKYGNVIRHAVFEAELAAALDSIGDKQQSQQFTMRAVAQLPAMRIEQPPNALQVLQILVHHDLISSQEALSLVPDLAVLPPARLTLAAVTGAQLWSDLASRLPEWQVQLDAEQLTLRGLVGKSLSIKRSSKLVSKGTQPLYACVSAGAEDKVKPEAVTPAPQLKRQFFTVQGQPVKFPNFSVGNDYAIVLSAPEVTAGPAEFLVPLPQEWSLRAVVPGSPIVGQYSWLKELDQVLAYRMTPDGLVLALNRPTAGSLKLALIVQARGQGKINWPAPQMAQFNAARAGTDEIINIE